MIGLSGEERMIMTIDEIQTIIRRILANPFGIEFNILELDDDVFTLHHLNIGQGDTYNRIVGQYERALKEEFLDNDSISVQDIYNIDQRKDVFYQVGDVSYIPRLNAMNDLLIANATGSANHSQLSYSKIWGFVITLGNDSESITLFKKHYPMNTLKQNVFLLRFINDAFSLVDNETNIRFDTEFHCFFLGGNWFVKDLKIFEKYFQFTEIEIQKANTTFQSIVDLNFIQADQALLTACLGKRAIARKILRIFSSSQVLARGISNERILAFSKEFEAYKGKFSYSPDDKIILSTQKDFNLYLKLMNDDYLVSELTDAVYDTEVKIPEVV